MTSVWQSNRRGNIAPSRAPCGVACDTPTPGETVSHLTGLPATNLGRQGKA